MSKHFFAIIILVVFLLNFSYPQTKDSAINSLQKSKWAMQFEVGVDFTLKSFDGMLFSLKYQLSSKSALRLGAGLGTTNRNSTLEDTATTYPASHNDLGLSVLGYYLFYPSPSSVINIFFGIGPRVFYSHSFDEVYEKEYTGYYKRTRESNSWNAGISGVLGAEWFATRSISFFGEYTFYAQFGKSKDRIEIKDSNGEVIFKNKLDSDDFRFQGSTARLGVSVYFNFPF